MTYLRWAPLVLFSALAQGQLFAVETVTTAAGTAATAANDAGSARAVALGSTYVGIAEGSETLLWNPAGLADLCASEVALDHDSTLVGSFQENILLGLPLGQSSGLGLSIDYADDGTFEGRDDQGALLGDYGARAFGANLGWGFRAPADLAFGAAVKVDREDLANDTIYSFAGDLGALWSPTPSLRVGAAYRNLGPDIAGSHLEQGFDLGASSYFWKGSSMEWLAAASVEALTHSDTDVHLGLETTLGQLFSLRAGYSFNVPHPDNADGLLGWTFGGGVKLDDLRLDYAYVPMAEIGDVQRLSLTYAFGDCVGGSEGRGKD
jgi:hypothetical protein